jgi:antitoxin component YwqK of YwqJK toxin-antitoxin module
MTKELTPYIEYHPNGNVLVKGQKNSNGQREGLWECFYLNENIYWRAPYVEGKIDGIAEYFWPNGNIIETHVWKDGKLIEITEH